MQLHVDDDGFVRAPAGALYPVLTDVARWDDFWPATEVERLADDRFAVRAGGRRPLRLTFEVGGWRHDQGFRLALRGDLVGDAEFWLEPGWGGTVVHHLATASPRSGRHAPAYRRWVRRGLWGLRDHLHAPVADGGPAVGAGA